jgi:hypothetical protein
MTGLFRVSNDMGSLLADVFAAKWLGHGRAVECMLACIAGVYGALLMAPGAGLESLVTYDIAWHGHNWLLGLALLSKSVLTGGGLILNIRGSLYAGYLRVLGALLGTIVWIWFFLKFAAVGAFVNVGFSFSIFAFLFSVRIMAMALANLPPPGPLNRG